MEIIGRCGFSFKFVGSLSIRCDEVKAPKGSQKCYNKSKKYDDRFFSILLHSHSTIKKSKIILSKYHILNHSLIYTIGRA